MIDPETPISGMSLDEIMTYVMDSRAPAGLVCAALVPDDTQVVDTKVYIGGNRAACVGLGDALKMLSRRRLIGYLEDAPDNLNIDTDDEKDEDDEDVGDNGDNGDSGDVKL